MFRTLIPFFTSSLQFLEQLVRATLAQLLGYACPDVMLRVSGLAVTDSVRFCGGRFDSFLGFEYVVMITLASHVFEYFLLQACVICAFWLRWGVTLCDPPTFLPTLTCGPFIGFFGFFRVGQSYSCVGVDRHDGYSADSSAGLAQCGFVGGFIPNFAIFALVSDHLRNFCFYSWDSLLVLTSLIRLPILLSLSLLWWLALGVTAAAHLLWWPLLCCLQGISFCSSSAVSSSSYFCYGCCQLLLSLLGVSVQLV